MDTIKIYEDTSMKSVVMATIAGAAMTVLATAIAIVGATILSASTVKGQSARDVQGTAAAQPLEDEPPAKIMVDAPLAEPLSHGRVVIQYRTENLHIVPVFGPAALAVSPRIGHLHLRVDDAQWGWGGTSGEPVMLNGLTPGPHKVVIQLANANHEVLDEGAVTFTVPQTMSTASAAELSGSDGPVLGPAQPLEDEPPARVIVDPPLSSLLSRGVAFIRYRTENLQMAPVFGPAAVAVSPRIGHIRVTVDNASWHWESASGGPVIVSGLAPGRHKILIELVNANHEVIDQSTVEFAVASAKHEHHVTQR